MSKNICPVCLRPYEYQLRVSVVDGKTTCLHDSEVPTSKTRLKRHENYDASIMALKMAAEQKRMDMEMGVGKEVPVQSYQKGSFGKTEMLPEKVIKSIEEKVASSPELQE